MRSPKVRIDYDIKVGEGRSIGPFAIFALVFVEWGLSLEDVAPSLVDMFVSNRGVLPYARRVVGS